MIGDSANAASIALHHAAGFSQVGTLRSVGYKRGSWVGLGTPDNARRPPKERQMAQHAKGSFTVQLKLLDEPVLGDGASLKRSLLEKTYEGDLQAEGRGQMFAALTPSAGSAGYVALERVDGVLKGRSGSFVLQHSGTMERGAETLSINVVPDSGTGELAGLRGTVRIIREDGVHSYDFDYSLPS